MQYRLLFDRGFDFDRDLYQLVVHVFQQAQDAEQFSSDERGQVDIIADLVEVGQALVQFKMNILCFVEVVQDPSKSAPDVFGYVIVRQ